MEGVTPEALRSAQREASEATRRLTGLELELRAAHDSLDVYRRAERETLAAGAGGGGAAGVGAGTVVGMRSAVLAALMSSSSAPDEGKSEGELRMELVQVREVLAVEAAEREKVSRLLCWVGVAVVVVTVGVVVGSEVTLTCIRLKLLLTQTTKSHPLRTTHPNHNPFNSSKSCLTMNQPSALKPKQRWKKPSQQRSAQSTTPPQSRHACAVSWMQSRSGCGGWRPSCALPPHLGGLASAPAVGV